MTAIAHVDWTHREGARKTGLIVFSGLSPDDEQRLSDEGREPQFLLTGGTRRTTVDVFNDYNPTDQFHADRVPLADAVQRAAQWLGVTGPVSIRENDETV